MAGVICPSCARANTDGEVLCVACGYELAEAARPPAPSPDDQSPDDQSPDAGESAVEAPTRCPSCGADVPDPANLVCVECLLELAPQPHPPVPPMTRHEGVALAPLRLLFPGQTIGVPPAGTVLLGRDAQYSPFAVLFADRDNVSRRHASVGLGPDGAAWIRDEFSTNGTFVNGIQVPSGGTARLADGDVVRIASDLTAQVELDRSVTR